MAARPVGGPILLQHHPLDDFLDIMRFSKLVFACRGLNLPARRAGQPPGSPLSPAMYVLGGSVHAQTSAPRATSLSFAPCLCPTGKTTSGPPRPLRQDEVPRRAGMQGVAICRHVNVALALNTAGTMAPCCTRLGFRLPLALLSATGRIGGAGRQRGGGSGGEEAPAQPHQGHRHWHARQRRSPPRALPRVVTRLLLSPTCGQLTFLNPSVRLERYNTSFPCKASAANLKWTIRELPRP